jgi:hypothetical protein
MNPNQPDPLAALRDIHLPEAVSFWPLAPGWWIALGIMVGLAVAIHALIVLRRRSLKRAALAELAEIEARYEGDGDVSSLALRLSTLLRRVALTRFRRREVASLAGVDWSSFLLRTGRKLGLSAEQAQGLGRAIYAGRYGLNDEEAPSRWIGASRRWIRGNA